LAYCKTTHHGRSTCKQQLPSSGRREGERENGNRKREGKRDRERSCAGTQNKTLEKMIPTIYLPQLGHTPKFLSPPSNTISWSVGFQNMSFGQIFKIITCPSRSAKYIQSISNSPLVLAIPVLMKSFSLLSPLRLKTNLTVNPYKDIFITYFQGTVAQNKCSQSKKKDQNPPGKTFSFTAVCPAYTVV
jgi:hypothetical protein